MRHIKELLRLKHEHLLSVREITRSCGLLGSTVHDYLVRAKAAGQGWRFADGLDELQLQQLLLSPARSQPGAAPPPEPPRRFPDWPEVHKELGCRSVTLRLLWQEYRQRFPDGHAYTQFCEYWGRTAVWTSARRGMLPLTASHTKRRGHPAERTYRYLQCDDLLNAPKENLADAVPTKHVPRRCWNPRLRQLPIHAQQARQH
jgi:hypothetical protein